VEVTDPVEVNSPAEVAAPVDVVTVEVAASGSTSGRRREFVALSTPGRSTAAFAGAAGCSGTSASSSACLIPLPPKRSLRSAQR
jgi:hypothetical protein